MGQLSINKSPKQPNLALKAPEQPSEAQVMVPVQERIVYVDRPVEVIVERPIEVIKTVEVVEYVYVDKPVDLVVTQFVDRPVEVVKYVEVPGPERIVEKIVQVDVPYNKIIPKLVVKVKYKVPNWAIILMMGETVMLLAHLFVR